MKIYALRHGLTEYNKLGKTNGQIVDDPLAKEGLEQIRNIVPHMPKGIAKIYSSDLLRARQTAELINETLQLPIEFCKELREVNFGTLAGKSWDDINAEQSRDVSLEYRTLKYDFHQFGGESVEDVRKRISTLMQILKERDAESVLLITHGGIIRFLYLFFNQERTEKVENLSIHEFTDAQ